MRRERRDVCEPEARRPTGRWRVLIEHFTPRGEVSFLRYFLRVFLAGRPGFEPGLTGSEPVVLPLNYLPSGERVFINRPRGAQERSGHFFEKTHIFLASRVPRAPCCFSKVPDHGQAGAETHDEVRNGSQPVRPDACSCVCKTYGSVLWRH